MTNLLSWNRKPSDQFAKGWFVGSTGDDGEHIRDQSGWPYSVYRKSTAIGGCDMCICHGIQDLMDAETLAKILNDRVDQVVDPWEPASAA